jgi:hypothetical protein
LSVGLGREGEEVNRLLGRHRDVGVLVGDRDVRQREGNEIGYRLIAPVEEMIGDPNLLSRDKQLLRAHLDIFVLHEVEPAGAQLRGRVVSDGGPSERPQDNEGASPHPR